MGFVQSKTLKTNSKYHQKPSKVFSCIRKRSKSIVNSMRMFQKCFCSSTNTIRRLQKCFRPSENAQNRWQIPSEGFKSVFVHPKTLKFDSKYHPKASKVFLFIQKGFKSIANSMQRVQKCFRSSKNALNRLSQNFKHFSH